MKRILTQASLALLTIGGAMLSSCSNDDGVVNPGLDGTINVARKADVKAYVGKNVLGNTLAYGSRGADVNGNLWCETWDCVPNVDLTPAELEELKALLSPGHEVENEVIIPFENYWVQQVYKGEDVYTATDYKGDNSNTSILGSDEMDHLKAYDHSIVTEVWWPEYSKTQGGYGHINNFNDGDNQTTYDACEHGIQHKGTTLMTGMSTEGVTPSNQFGFDETWGTSPKFYNNYYIVQYKGEWYVGFDYEAHKNDQTSQNSGEARHFERDWNFTDWIVKITPAYAKGMTPETPGEVEPGQPSEPQEPEDPDQPGTDTPAIPQFDNEVEVNLSIEEKENGWDDLMSHLSIHVRAATDVEVFIPIPVDYYCEADDMEIVQIHDKNHSIHGGPESVTYTLQDKEDGPYYVTLNIEYLENGIRIWTEGINQDVIDFCYKHYQDGLTFEVWNYFNESATLDILKQYLNQATVEFLDLIPDAYINAFNDDATGAKNEDDCTVSIVESQQGYYEDPVEGNHYNGSPYNEIYQKK